MENILWAAKLFRFFTRKIYYYYIGKNSHKQNIEGLTIFLNEYLQYIYKYYTHNDVIYIYKGCDFQLFFINYIFSQSVAVPIFYFIYLY